MKRLFDFLVSLDMVKKMGKAARLRVHQDFNELDIVNEKIRFVTDQVSKINC